MVAVAVRKGRKRGVTGVDSRKVNIQYSVFQSREHVCGVRAD